VSFYLTVMDIIVVDLGSTYKAEHTTHNYALGIPTLEVEYVHCNDVNSDYDVAFVLRSSRV
jgi:hypothetical protein